MSGESNEEWKERFMESVFTSQQRSAISSAAVEYSASSPHTTNWSIDCKSPQAAHALMREFNGVLLHGNVIRLVFQHNAPSNQPQQRPNYSLQQPTFPLHVSGLKHHTVTSAQLLDTFKSRYPSCVSGFTVPNRGIGFVRFSDKRERERAMYEMDNFQLGGAVITLSLPKNEDAPAAAAASPRVKQERTLLDDQMDMTNSSIYSSAPPPLFSSRWGEPVTQSPARSNNKQPQQEEAVRLTLNKRSKSNSKKVGEEEEEEAEPVKQEKKPKYKEEEEEKPRKKSKRKEEEDNVEEAEKKPRKRSKSKQQQEEESSDAAMEEEVKPSRNSSKKSKHRSKHESDEDEAEGGNAPQQQPPAPNFENMFLHAEKEATMLRYEKRILEFELKLAAVEGEKNKAVKLLHLTEQQLEAEHSKIRLLEFQLAVEQCKTSAVVNLKPLLEHTTHVAFKSWAELLACIVKPTKPRLTSWAKEISQDLEPKLTSEEEKQVAELLGEFPQRLQVAPVELDDPSAVGFVCAGPVVFRLAVALCVLQTQTQLQQQNIPDVLFPVSYLGTNGKRKFKLCKGRCRTS